MRRPDILTLTRVKIHVIHRQINLSTEIKITFFFFWFPVEVSIFMLSGNPVQRTDGNGWTADRTAAVTGTPQGCEH